MFYITISNGLLKDGHRKRMGISVWEFMWCIDKVTRVDKDGLGWVLGGKPINLKELAEDLEVDEETISRNLITLEEQNYIEKTRTPYGIILKVKKIKKRFGKNVESLQKRIRKSVESHRKSVESNKTLQTDDNNSIAVATAIRKDLIDFYFQATEKKQGFTPEFDGGDGKALNIAIRKFKPEEIKDQINFYLNSEKATRNGVTLKAIFSTHSVNSWKQNGHKNKFL